MGEASSAIFRLRPVTYRYKQPYADGSKPIDYGLIAEEVAEVYPDLVVKGADGQIQTVQYQKLTPMLLNELQKQHQLVEQMGKTMAQQQQTIQLLKAQQTETVQLLEKRLAALEAAQPSTNLEARVATH
jgi:trimeric autotransporter adhesin